MEADKQVFVGLLKMSPNVFVMGEFCGLLDSQFLSLKNVVRVIEVHTQDQRTGYSFHPDPYFTVDKETKVQASEFLFHRIEKDPNEKMMKEYDNFLTQLRVQKSGIHLPHPPKPPAPQSFMTGSR